MSIDNTRVDEPNVIQLQGVVTSYKNHLRRTILLMAAFVLITALGGYGLNLIWTGYPGNTLWDWLHLLLIPVSLTAATLFFSGERVWRREWTLALLGVALFLAISAFGGYLFNWTWTGFRGNTLWNWFELFFSPVGLATLSIFFGVKRVWQREWLMALGASTVLLLLVIAGGYLLHWPWTGFQGNTLWDWLKLLLLPVALVVASVSFKGHERVWTIIIVLATMFLLVALVGGYAFGWTWTGFAGNTLWDWLHLLLLPLVVTAAEPLFSTYRDEGVAVATIGGVFLLMAAIGGYVFYWTWTGFQNNTLWDWFTLLLLPLALVAARISYNARKTPANTPITTVNNDLPGTPVSPEPPASVASVPTEQTKPALVEPALSAAPLVQPQLFRSSVPSARQRRILRLSTLAAVLLIVFLAVPGMVFSARAGKNGTSAGQTLITSVSQIAGTVTFFSTHAGTNDGLHLQLQHVPDPSYGNQYYAWLQGTPATIALGTLTVHNGTVSLSYVDPHQRDLLGFTRTFLITEEAVDGIYNSPTLDQQQWRYEGSWSQTTSASQSSLLDNLQHLLSNEPTLEQWGLHGGAADWFLHNSEQMQAAAIEVRDHHNLDTVRQQLADILYYLDGKCAAQDLRAAAGPQQPENTIIAHDTSASLLDCTQGSSSYGLLTNMQKHLLGVAQSPGVISGQASNALHIDNELNAIHTALEEMRADALALVMLNDAQLGAAPHHRAALASLASTLVNGGVDPTTHMPVAGAQATFSDIEALAMFSVNKYTM